MLLGLGFAVKPTVLLLTVGLALGFVLAPTQGRGIPRAPIRAISIPLDDESRVLAGLVAGFAVVAGVSLGLIGSAGIGQTVRASGLVSAGSPWRVVRTVLSYFVAEPVANDVVRCCATALAISLAVVVLRRMRGPQSRLLPDPWATHPVVGGAFVLVIAWLAAWPYVLPWYDALAWALLALLPASGFDWLLLARTTVLAFGYLPARATGITIPVGLRWMEPVLRTAVTPAVLATLLVLLVGRRPVVTMCDGYSSKRDSDRDLCGGGAGRGDRHFGWRGREPAGQPRRARVQ
jgi:hypothetical protein